MYGHVRIQMIIVAFKMSWHCGVVIVFNVKYVTLESIYDSVFCLPYIFGVGPVAFQAIYQVITLASAFDHFIVGFIVYIFFIFPDLEIFCNICRYWVS